MEQENLVMDAEVLYPVLWLPKKCTSLETECGVTENVYIDLNISSVDTEGNTMNIYSGYCDVKLVDDYDCNNKTETIDFNQVPIIIDETPVDTSLNQFQVWIDPVRSPNVYNHYEAMEALENYSMNSQTRTSRVMVEKHSTYITQNVYNYEESIRYSPVEEYEHKKFKKIHYNEQPNCQNTSIDHNNFNLYEDDEFQCGVFLSQLSEEIINEKENRVREERRFSETQSQNDALKQLMSTDIQSFSKQTKTILFFGHDKSHGETIQKIGVIDPTVECSDSQYHGDQYDPAPADPNQKKYQCEKCKQIFHQLSTFKDHMKGGHRRSPRAFSPAIYHPSNRKQYICTECGKILKTPEKFETHMAHHGDPELECNRCRKVFATKFTLRAHYRIHTRKYPCSMCYKSFAAKKELAHHVGKSHPIPRCHQCNYYFTKYEDLEAHLLCHEKQEVVDTSETEFAGSFIEDELTNQNFMMPEDADQVPVEEKYEEQRMVSPKGEDDNDAKNADYVIAKLMSNNIFKGRCKKSKRHRRTDKMCEVCHKVFDRIGDLKRHLIEHVVRSTLAKTPVSADGTLTIQCEVCQLESFSKIDRYKAHLREHAKLTLYKCTFCDKSFSDSSNFSKHKKIHGVSFLQCDLCQRKFNSKKMITQHMEYHMRNPPISCDYCLREFHFKSMLNKHIKTSHTKEVAKRFRCRFCRNCFRSLKEKWDHEWSVHKVRKIVVDCLLCGCKFRKYSELKRHCGYVHDMQIPRASKLLKIK